MYRLFYDLIDANFYKNIGEHPQRQMQKLGYKVLYSEPVSVCDGWIFEVEELIEPLPSYLIYDEKNQGEREWKPSLATMGQPASEQKEYCLPEEKLRTLITDDNQDNQRLKELLDMIKTEIGEKGFIEIHVGSNRQ